MEHTQRFEAVLAASERVAFRLNDVLRKDAELDFTRPFLPERLARSQVLDALTAEDRLRFNQIRGHTYLCMFGLVEEFILPFVLDHARPGLNDVLCTRALLGFASEEAKHIELFQRFRACFERGFGSHCEVIGPAEQIAQAVLAHGPLGVAWAILHIEWMTQRHYVDAVKDDSGLEPRFAGLLRHHWLEEAQHAKLDAWMVERLAAQLSAREIDASVNDYLAIIEQFSNLLDAQLELELASLERRRGCALSEPERRAVTAVQRPALRWTFLGSGMTHPTFLSLLAELSPAGAARVRAASVQFC